VLICAVFSVIDAARGMSQRTMISSRDATTQDIAM
jgi:hypothetical protein